VLLVVLTCVALLLSTVAVWARNLVLDSNRFARTGAAALTNEAVADVVAVWTAGQVTELVIGYIDLDIPIYFRPFARKFEAAVQESITTGLRDLIVSDRTEEALRRALREVHDRLVNAAGDKDAVVTVNLVPLVSRGVAFVQDKGFIPGFVELPGIDTGRTAEEQIAALEAATGRDLPDDFGQFKIYDGATITRAGGVLSAVATIIGIVRRVTTLALVVTGALLIASLLVSPRRGRTAIYLVVGAGVAMFVGSVAIDSIRERLPDLVQPTTREAILQVFDDFVNGLLQFTRLTALALAVLAIGAVVARRVRDAAPSSQSRDLLDVLHAHPDVVRITALLISLVALAGFGLSIATVTIVAIVSAVAYAVAPVTTAVPSSEVSNGDE